MYQISISILVMHLYVAICIYIYLSDLFVAGRRGDIKLEWILRFGTATDEEPLLGFKLAPKIRFTEMTNSFLPTANTCINVITIPYASNNTQQLPAAEVLFALYDEAFSSAHFGHI